MALKHALLALTLAAGCSGPLHFEAPRGFAEADRDWRSIHYKASDNVGLKLLLFDNVEGGTLDYWGADLVRKLSARGYALRDQSALRSGNDVVGTRFDFAFARDDEPPQFLVVNLFVTDEFLYVAQLAGEAPLLPRYDARITEIAAALLAKGCLARSDVCNGPQPPALVTVSPPEDRRTAAPTAPSESAASDPTSGGSPGSARGEAPSPRSAPPA
jgi:hypothetical protein